MDNEASGKYYSLDKDVVHINDNAQVCLFLTILTLFGIVAIVLYKRKKEY